ncbi:MAG: hypothetical protein JJE47_16540 [Acidimicrobiia bacterium]|nr:hypothetical protein [Acidimicrobiia bacterium]
MTSPGPFRRWTPGRAISGTTVMVVGAVGAAIGSYLFQLVVGRALGPTVFAPVSALWTFQFLIFTIVILPLEQMLVSRIVAGKAGSLVRLTGITASVTCVFVVAIGYVWRTDLFAGSIWFGFQLGLIVLVYTWFALRRARLAAGGRYRRYGFVTLLESAIRFMVAAAILVAGGGAIEVGWALVAGGLAALFAGRTIRPVHGVSQASDGASLLWALVAANGTGQLLLAGGPLAAATFGLAPEQISIVFMVMVLYRAPITLAYGVVARVIRPLVELQIESGRDGLRSLATRSLMIAAPVAVIAWFGPSVPNWFNFCSVKPSLPPGCSRRLSRLAWFSPHSACLCSKSLSLSSTPSGSLVPGLSVWELR